ncbi:hypothetical protein CEY11_09450 [Candidimonas nitroreducens]|uniref:Uncharacterized protein n=1 Tax=Candidimonas nitroreducens TaxID=683354 RepID=A0A225MRC1_9BURK|nr:hypothetical protein CEY11_09450 [Candidimonas nitroreducens]
MGGWNARDPLAAMAPGDAIILNNFFPQPGGVALRNGSLTWATGLGNQVNTIMGYNPAAGMPKLFAAAGGSIFDVTAGGAVGAADVSGLSNSIWSHLNFATPAGPFLLAVNGQDGYYIYNGSAWQSVTASSSPISITGVDPISLSAVQSYASSVWFTQKDSLTAYYLPVVSVGGAATAFPMNQIFRRGGRLVAMGVWTVDGGYGMQDYLCFATSEGEIAIYGGTDPSQSSTWSLVGVYQVGTPMGARCFMKYGGDLLYIGKDGLGPVSRLLGSSRVNTETQLTYKIQGAISQATASYATNFGWQMMLHPLQNQLFLNVPIALGQQQQYVMNTITGGWCNFTGWPANCWERWQDRLYFGANGKVIQAWTNNLDDDGEQIQGEALQAFQTFGSGQLKQFLMARPILQGSGNFGTLLGVNVDFDTGSPVGNPSFTPSTAGLWDQGFWDQALWGGQFDIAKNWQQANAMGTWGAAHLRISGLDASINWTATEYLLRDAGVL